LAQGPGEGYLTTAMKKKLRVGLSRRERAIKKRRGGKRARAQEGGEGMLMPCQVISCLNPGGFVGVRGKKKVFVSPGRWGGGPYVGVLKKKVPGDPEEGGGRILRKKRKKKPSLPKA